MFKPTLMSARRRALKSSVAVGLSFATAAIATSLFASTSVHAQSYPTKPITLVVGFAAGGPTDIVARALAQSMTKTLGQAVAVDNKPGAGATIAGNLVAKAKPDGYSSHWHGNGPGALQEAAIQSFDRL